ncbi:hypothetical protein BKA62DRAFT_831879 [Auriculariales sp. MPI-PUGE-AT-0066]|nr:hypothetical protein BKA62DRAFT_831879 [Auriculariales sp. MPI-PUGE-AT-0066]
MQFSTFALTLSLLASPHPHSLDAAAFPVTFVTGSTKVSFRDLTVSFGVVASDSANATNIFGTPLVNVDLVSLGKSDTGPGSFEVSVPITQAQLSSGPGSYVLTAAVVRAVGNPGSYVWRADQFTIPFTASFAE